MFCVIGCAADRLSITGCPQRPHMLLICFGGHGGHMGHPGLLEALAGGAASRRQPTWCKSEGQRARSKHTLHRCQLQATSQRHAVQCIGLGMLAQAVELNHMSDGMPSRELSDQGFWTRKVFDRVHISIPPHPQSLSGTAAPPAL